MLEFISFAFLAVFIGMKHGMDGDHVAAIADMVGTENKRKKQVSLGVMYAFGHGLIVLFIGLVTIIFGANLPSKAQMFIEMMVSFTLILLGGMILYSIFQQKKDFEYKSRIKMVSEFALKYINKSKDANLNVTPIGAGIVGAFVIGIIHGIGVESPTQLAIITNAAGINNLTAALLQLTLFVSGLLISTILITFLLSWGFIKASLKKKIYIILGSVTGIYSISLGMWMAVELL
ncbi:High-affinity nickel-transporter [Alteribacillus sp. JSM 102045]|uniref:High-affinity nickel-transporter n=1 Tax=Alteribacillus sp. JSM 102045 TaxID=1562101 RepID=UPI0035C1CAEA